MKFQSEKGFLFGIAILGSAAALLIIGFTDLFTVKYDMSFYFAQIVSLLVAMLLLWFWFGTYYLIKDDKLIYRCGPIRGSVKIREIHTLIKNKTLWGGMKPVLATKGIIVKYNRYDEIYISPKDKDAFISEILKVNSEVKIVN